MRKHMKLAGAVLAALTTTAAANPAPLTEVFFGFDSAELSTEAQNELDEAATQAMGAAGATVVINGFADQRGTSTYNVGLSIRRGEAAREYLVAKGVDPDQIVMAYFGEDAANRATFAEDRRVTVELTRDALYTVIDRSLPVATAVTWQQPKTTAEIDGPQLEQVAER